MRYALIFMGLVLLSVTPFPAAGMDVVEEIDRAMKQIDADAEALKRQSAALDKRREAIEGRRAVIDEKKEKLSAQMKAFRFRLSDRQVRAYKRVGELENESSVSAYLKTLTKEQLAELGAISDGEQRVEDESKSLDRTIEDFNRDIETYNRENERLAQRRQALPAAIDAAAAATEADVQRSKAFLNAVQSLAAPRSTSNTINCLPFGSGVTCTETR